MLNRAHEFHTNCAGQFTAATGLFATDTLAARGPRRLDDVDRVGGGKGVLQSFLQRLLQLLPSKLLFVLALLALVLDALVLHQRIVRDAHRPSPIAVWPRRPLQTITRRARRAFPCYDWRHAHDDLHRRFAASRPPADSENDFRLCRSG